MITWLIWGLIVIGLVLRFTVRDRYFPWAMLYYVTPIPSLATWVLLAGLVGSPPTSWRRSSIPVISNRWLSPAGLNFLLVPVFIVWALSSEYFDRAQPASQDDLRLVFWNVARMQANVDSLVVQLNSFDAQVVALVEAEGTTKRYFEEWQSKLPEYQVVGTDFGGLIAVKGTVKSHQRHSLNARSPCEQFDLKIDGSEFTVLLVDIASDLNRSRRVPLLALAKLAESLADRPVIIMGDFNTPDDSALLVPLRKHFRQAFRERGIGYAATWPMPLPVLTLDHVWFNEPVIVSRCRLGWTALSDHRPVITNVSFPNRK